MRKQLLIAMLAIILPALLLGQQTTADVNVGVSVKASLTATKDTDVHFGNVSLDASPVLDPTGASHSDVGATATVGVVTLGGSEGASVTVTFPGTVNLGDGTATTIPFTPSVAGHATTQSSASSVTSGSQITLGASGYKLWIGGSLNLTSAIAGTYTSNASNGDGDMTITLEYY